MQQRRRPETVRRKSLTFHALRRKLSYQRTPAGELLLGPRAGYVRLLRDITSGTEHSTLFALIPRTYALYCHLEQARRLLHTLDPLVTPLQTDLSLSHVRAHVPSPYFLGDNNDESDSRSKQFNACCFAVGLICLFRYLRNDYMDRLDKRFYR